MLLPRLVLLCSPTVLLICRQLRFRSLLILPVLISRLMSSLIAPRSRNLLRRLAFRAMHSPTSNLPTLSFLLTPRLLRGTCFAPTSRPLMLCSAPPQLSQRPRSTNSSPWPHQCSRRCKLWREPLMVRRRTSLVTLPLSSRSKRHASCSTLTLRARIGSLEAH